MVKLNAHHWDPVKKGHVYESWYNNVIQASGVDTVVARRIVQEWGGEFWIDYFTFPDETTATVFLLRWS
jgi:hypothetical protein